MASRPKTGSKHLRACGLTNAEASDKGSLLTVPASPALLFDSPAGELGRYTATTFDVCNLRLFAALVIAALGVVLTIGDGFLFAWNVQAGEAHDIAARGPWLLAMLVPQILCAAAVALSVLALLLGRRGIWPLASRILLPTLAVLAVGALLYADPTSIVFRILLPIRQALRGAGASLLDIALLFAGGWLLWNERKPVKSLSPAV